MSQRAENSGNDAFEILSVLRVLGACCYLRLRNLLRPKNPFESARPYLRQNPPGCLVLGVKLQDSLKAVPLLLFGFNDA